MHGGGGFQHDNFVTLQPMNTNYPVMVESPPPKTAPPKEPEDMSKYAYSDPFRKVTLHTFLLEWMLCVWPRGTCIPKLPSALISTVDHPLGSPSLIICPWGGGFPQLPSAVMSTGDHPLGSSPSLLCMLDCVFIYYRILFGLYCIYGCADNVPIQDF
jgi:hypothetical protein